MEMPWAERKALVSRIHKIDTGILTSFARTYNFDQLFSLRLDIWKREKDFAKKYQKPSPNLKEEEKSLRKLLIMPYLKATGKPKEFLTENKNVKIKQKM